MRLLTFRDENGKTKPGLLHGTDVFDIHRLVGRLYGDDHILTRSSLADLLDMNGEPYKQARALFNDKTRLLEQSEELFRDKISFPSDQAELLLPFRPRTVLCTGNNYVDHLEEKEKFDNADMRGDGIEFFSKLSDCIIGPYDPIPYSNKLTVKLDYENELAVIIGSEAWQVDPEEARNCILGYTVFNDLSARDRQLTKEGCYKLGLSKNFEGCGSMGPVVVTMDEFEYPPKLQLVTKVNDVVRQSTNTELMINDPAFLVSHFSKFFKLHPGYVMITGTCGGTAWSTDPEIGGVPYEREDIVRGDYLKVGDLVVCSIEDIGELRNRVE